MNEPTQAEPSPNKQRGAVSGRPWYSIFQRTEVLYATLGLATVLVFLSVRSHGFVNIDDEVYVTENSHVRTGLRTENLVWAFRTGHASNWHPLTWVSHMLDCQLFGLDAVKHHLVSLGWHIANTLLLFGVLTRMTGCRNRSFMVAALFALHPLRVESVAWIAERKDVLSGFFFLLTLWAYARYVEGRKLESQDPKSESNPSIFYSLALVLFAFGLMSKPMIVTTPFLLLLLDYWPLNRIEMRSAKGAWKAWLPLLREKVPFLVLSVISGAITLAVQKHGGAVQSSLPAGARLSNALVSYVKYIGKIFWPGDLAVLYPHPGQWPAGYVLGSALLLTAISLTAIALAGKRPWLFVGWFWFLGALGPVIGIVQVGLQAMADRYTYLPSIGIFIVAVWGVSEVVVHLPIWKGAPAAFSAGVLIALSMATIRQLRHWQNGETLLQHALQVTGNNYLILNNLGTKMSGSNAIQNFEAALKLNPASGDAHNNLGVELAMRGDLPAAIEHFRAAIAVQPLLASAHSNLGMALAVQHKWAEAIAEYRESLRLNPDDSRVHSNLGNALDEQGKSNESVEQYRQALRLDPDNAEIHFNLAMTLAKQGHRDEAMAQYVEGLRLQPDNAQAKQELERLKSSRTGSP